MSKLGLIACILSIAGALTFATFTASADDAAGDAPAAAACIHTEFKTTLVKDACTKGGQKAAKDAMKAFMKEKKIKSCNQCHSKLAPKYELKKDALEQFQKAGGK
jgi:NAD-dependent SIR2 family protein deacetylase